MPRALIVLAILILASVATLIFLNSDGTDVLRDELEESETARSQPPTVAPIDAPEESRPSGAAPLTATLHEPNAEPETRQLLGESSEQISIRGRLIDPEGQPLPGGQLVAIRFPKGMDESELSGRMMDFFRMLEGKKIDDIPMSEAVADKDGRAELSIPADFERVFVFARAKGCQLALKKESIGSEEKAHDIGDLILAPAIVLEVAVVDASGQPVVGATVGVLGDFTSDTASMPLFFTQTDEQGLGRFPYMTPGELMLGVRAQGHAEASVELELDSDAEPHLERIQLEAGVGLEGVVLNADGTPSEGVAIRIERQELDESKYDSAFSPLTILDQQQAWATTDAEGRFQGGGLNENSSYVLTATRAERITVSSEVVKPGDTVTLRLPAEFAAFGLLIHAESGEPVQGAEIYLVPTEEDFAIYGMSPIKTEEDGSFRQSLMHGSYRVLVRHDKAELALDGPFVVEGDYDLGTIELEDGGTLVVRLQSARNGEAIRGAVIDIEGGSSRSHTEENASAGQRELIAIRDYAEEFEPGSYRMSGILPGAYSFSIQEEGHVELEFEAEIRKGETTELTRVLSPAASLTLTVHRSDGQPAEGQSMLLVSMNADENEEDEGYDWNLYEECNELGVAEFTQIDPGPYEVRGPFNDRWRSDDLDDPALTTVELAPGKNRLQVTLQPTLTLMVQVTDFSGRPLEGIGVWSTEKEDHWGMLSGYREPEGRTDESGMHRLEDLEIGQIQVHAARSGGCTRSVEVDLAGDGQQVEIQLGGFRISGRVTAGVEDFEVSLSPSKEPEEQAELAEKATDELGHLDMSALMPHFMRTQGQVLEGGEFVFHDVPAGRYRIDVHAEGYYQDPAIITQVVVEDSDIDGVLAEVFPEAKLTVRVTGMSSDNRLDYIVRAVGAQGELNRSIHFIHGNGTYEMNRLPPGVYTVQIGTLGEDRFDLEDIPVIAEYPVSITSESETVVDWSP